MAKGKRWNMKSKLAEMERTKKRLPKIIANEMEKHYLETFDNEEWDGDPWAKRKSSTKRDRQTGKRRNLLVQSGSLRGSIRVGSATWKKIAVGSYGIKYAKFHNQGIGKLPQRQFVGMNNKLEKRITKIVRKMVTKSMQK